MKAFKKFSLMIVIVLTVVFSVCLTACNNYSGRIESITKIADLGNFDGYDVRILKLKYKYEEVAEVTVPLYVGDTYICNLPNACYKVVVSTDDGELDLRYAYKNGYIGSESLSAIAKIAQQAFQDDGNPPDITVDGLTAEQVLGFKKAYFNNLYNAPPEDIGNIEILHWLGTYNDDIMVVMLKYQPAGNGAPEVEIPYYVNGTYICTLPNPSYKIVTAISKAYIFSCHYLQETYDGGSLNDDNLAEIAKRAQKALGESEN